MRIVLDTNVFISGIFFQGPAHAILKAWESGDFTLLLSVDIFAEYQRVSRELLDSLPQIDIEPILEFIATHGEMVVAHALPGQVCEDPDDDKFLSCAAAGNADYLVTGDKLLLKLKTYAGIPIVTPRNVIDNILK